MTPSISKSLEEKISGLLASLAVTNEGLMNLTKISQKHDTVLYGDDENGGLITRGNVDRRTLSEHAAVLDRLEKSCASVAAFMESQIEVNRTQEKVNQAIGRSILLLGGVVFLILLLIGIADISALRAILAHVLP